MLAVVEVRRTTREQWQTLRELRLRALTDAPAAFGSTLARDRAHPDAEWQRRAAGDCWLAWDDGRAVGMVALVPDVDGADVRQLVSMWIAPEVRGTGAAAALIEAACDGACAAGAAEVVLWVADGNDRARRAYERCGFRATGERQPLPSDPAVAEERMRRRLPAR